MFRHIDACGSQSTGTIIPISATFKWILPTNPEEINRQLENCNGLGLKSPLFNTPDGSKWQLGICPSTKIDKNNQVTIGDKINIHMRRVNSQGNIIASVALSIIIEIHEDDVRNYKVLRTRRVDCFEFQSDSLACGFDDLIEPGDFFENDGISVLCEIQLELGNRQKLKSSFSPCHCLELVESAHKVVEAGGIAVAEYKRLLRERFYGVHSQLHDAEFQPTVTAMCQTGLMNIRVSFNQSFVGAVHSRGQNKDFRRPPCMVAGNGSNQINLKVDLYAMPDSPEYCGIIVNNNTDERSLSIAVRIHKTLELADDKFYVITCGNTKYRNARNETSLVSLRLLDSSGRRVHEAIYGHNYTLRTEISPVDNTYGFKVRSCLAFDTENHNVTIIDSRGCPENSGFISKFTYDRNAGTAESTLSAFRFSKDHKQLHLQCEIVLCKESCGEPICDDEDKALSIKTGNLAIKGQTPKEEEAVLHAATSVFVLSPGQDTVSELRYGEKSIHPDWLLWLAIVLGVLLLIMFIINVFLCSAMTCSCARTEIIEKEPSIIEDYDPYRSWHGSQYGSRFDTY
ncbi:hypothetical protein QAD02_023389 [Eretmocerus hayati]|uniref:Uncharacterized protein n=1 Tax=Eretmocerus hayati TaxID=131215 RepID=A0ACC2PVH6_9HYME|nr:hypothetical protein QAD02_023389 [Eretmocerus hayati]